MKTSSSLRTGSEPLGQIALGCEHSSHSPRGALPPGPVFPKGPPRRPPRPPPPSAPFVGSHPHAWPHAHMPGRQSQSSLSFGGSPPGPAAWDCRPSAHQKAAGSRCRGLAASVSLRVAAAALRGLGVVSSSCARPEGVASLTPRPSLNWITAGPVGYLKPRVIFVLLQTGPPGGQI